MSHDVLAGSETRRHGEGICCPGFHQWRCCPIIARSSSPRLVHFEPNCAVEHSLVSDHALLLSKWLEMTLFISRYDITGKGELTQCQACSWNTRRMDIWPCRLSTVPRGYRAITSTSNSRFRQRRLGRQRVWRAMTRRIRQRCSHRIAGQ